MEVLEVIKSRRSIYNFSEKDIEKTKIVALIEAARLAPSSFNNQPWKYVFVHRKDKNRRALEDALAVTNGWAKKAPYLIVLFSRGKDDTTYNEIPYYLYDCGLSAMSLVLEAEHQGLRAHQMAGWSANKVRDVVGIGEDYTPVVMIAVGYEEKNPRLLQRFLGALKDGLIRNRKRKSRNKISFFGKFR
jgi:nitroreductase